MAAPRQGATDVGAASRFIVSPVELPVFLGGCSVNEFLSSIVVIGLGIALLSLTQNNTSERDRRIIWMCFWAHIASAFILIWLTYNVLGGGDIEVYYYYGEALSQFVERNPGRWAPEVLKLIFQLDAELPIHVYGSEGSSTTTMIGITCFLMLATGGAEYGTGLLFSLLAFSGQIGMYKAFRAHIPEEYQPRFLVAIFLVPSAVFWTSGVVKEAVAIGGMGWMVWGLHLWIVEKRRLIALIWLYVGGVLVSIAKAYVLFPMAIAGGIWWFWHHSLSTKGSVGVAAKPLYLIGAAAVAMVVMIGLGELFPQYSVAELGEEAAELQYQGQRVDGGSNYQMGDPTETSLGGQLAFAPVAISSALFRPMIVEAHNAVAIINGLEMLAVKLLWLVALYRRGFGGIWRLFRSSPALMFCAVFVLLFSLGVGLATTNLGTLSRYRVPMMPMYVMMLMMAVPKDSDNGR